jgi:regulator of protease activity HflC (stomatin/prohibitin superfamily)
MISVNKINADTEVVSHIALILFKIFFSSFFTVKQQTAVVIERFGKFQFYLVPQIQLL